MPRKKPDTEEAPVARPYVRWRVKPGKIDGKRVFYLTGDDEWWGTYDTQEEADAEKTMRETFARMNG